MGLFQKSRDCGYDCAFVDQCFAAPDNFSAMHLTIGVVFYSFQIYCDFSGYSDIAIGLARIMGFDFPTISARLIFRKISANFGRAGTSRCPRGCEITSIFRLAAIGVARLVRYFLLLFSR